VNVFGKSSEDYLEDKIMCDLCLKKESVISYDIRFQGMTPFPISICNHCREVLKYFYLVICKTCGSMEFWNKKSYGSKFDVPPTDKFEVLATHTCLNCVSCQLYGDERRP
jgi:hypothetical protein